jgi:mRNA-degrading endonuclease RelE of RelBE toxin-antitoxin system
MNWTIKLSSQAEKHFRRLPKSIRLRVASALAELGALSYPTFHKDVLSLSGELQEYHRLRVGEYRVIFRVLKVDKIIAVVGIYPRGDAYKKA